MDVEVIKVYSFTDTCNGGNPAGVVLNPEQLSDHQMMMISKKLQVSETAFLFPSDDSDYYVRFFSPSCEVDLCGHATIAAFSVLGTLHESNEKTLQSFIQKTHAGLLSVFCYYDVEFGLDYVMMEQKTPVSESVDYKKARIADALHISVNHLSDDIVGNRVSTGLFTLPVCVDSLKTLRNMKPDFEKVRSICHSLDVGSFHVFTFDTIEPSSCYHARNFAPVYGINEDPVTGTANGAVCAFLKNSGLLHSDTVICEQGDIIGRSGRVYVDISKKNVLVGGKTFIDAPVVIQV